MAAWLGSILGVVVVGVIVELLTQQRRMGKFIRSIYGFIVLLVIVSPLPKMLQTEWWSANFDELVNQELLANLEHNSKQAQIKQILHAKGYDQALVTVVDDVIYVNLGVTVDATVLQELQQNLGEGVVVL